MGSPEDWIVRTQTFFGIVIVVAAALLPDLVPALNDLQDGLLALIPLAFQVVGALIAVVDVIRRGRGDKNAVYLLKPRR